MSTAELSKECFPHYRSVLPVKWLGVVFCLLIVLALTSSSKAAAFAPYFYDAFITNRLDLDGDGYARQFDIAFDADSNISGQCYIKVYEYDGGFGFDDLLLTTTSFAVSGTVTDYRLIRIVCSDYPGADLLNRGAAEIRLDLYNAANNTLIQSWTPGNDPDLSNIMVELASEDSVPVLSIASITPSSMQTRARGQTVVYTIVVRDTNGSPVSGATVFGTNHLEGRTFTTTPTTTEGSGQITYTTTVPICNANGIFDVSFSASKPGWVTSQPTLRQVQVNQPANRAPVASASQIRGQPPILRIGEVCSISADYTDPDGADDLRFCLLRVGHPSTPLAFAYDTLTGTVQPITTNLQTFISPVTVERTNINNGVRLTWHFFLKRTWPLVDSQIDFSVGALDRCGLEDGWNSDGRSLAFQNPPYGCTFIIHGFQAFSAAVPEWVTTMGGRIARRLGNGEVYEYEPASTSFIRHPQLSVGTNAAFEKVFLFNWSDESDNLATGYAEAAADAFFAAIIRAQQAVPSDPFLNRIHLIGHSRGCVVGSELLERLHALSAQGEDTNLFHYPIDTRIDVTFLDPHTTGTTLTGDFGDPEVNSPYLPERGVVVWSNVGHANNYYQTQNDNSFFYLNGEFVPGSRNRNLDSPVLVGIDHSEVHAWYFGTIDPEATQDELAAMILEEKGNTETTAFFLQPFQVNAAPPQAPMMESVLIQRPQWYLDNVGVTEGYAHTRRGGEITHNESREPLDATPAQDSFHDLIIDGIFNGNFKHGVGEVVDMPGWDRHSGGGEGVLDAGHLRLEDPLISPNARYRRHNLLFVPSTAEKLGFRLRVYQSDTRTPPNADRMVVKLGTNTIGGQPGREIWLTQSSTAFRSMILEIPASLRGTANTLTLEIVPGGSTVNAEVWIDDLTWLDDSYLNVSLARLPAGGTEVTMRGKILSRYAIEASPDLVAWSQLAVVTNTTGTITYTDTAATSQQRRFYRVLSVP